MNCPFYVTPRCEYDVFVEAVALLTGSDLTDDGPGGLLDNGDEYTF